MPASSQPKKPNLFALLRPYRGFVVLLVAAALLSNGLNLVLPRLISQGIDAYGAGFLVISSLAWKFSMIAIGIAVFAYGQTILQTYVSEVVARDLRQKLTDKISKQSHTYIQTIGASKLLTNLTSDIDSIKLFISMAIAAMISSVFIILGASTLLLMTNWKLGLAVLALLPVIAAVFFVILGKVRVLFVQGRDILDRLNKVINESILGAALIRVLHAKKEEDQKFLSANTEAMNLGFKILGLFAGMIPIVTFVSNLANLVILLLGGHFVIQGTMSLGEYAAFTSYLMILIFPIFMLGFVSNIMAQAGASYQRIAEVLETPEEKEGGDVSAELKGGMAFDHVGLQFGEKAVLKDVSFEIKPKTRTAIIGPTAAGKTQLLSLLTGLRKPTSGHILYDGRDLQEYHPDSLHAQVGFVFQDSIMFNLSLRENIAFNQAVSEESLRKAIETAELQDFIDTLPEKLETIVSERGASLSGGQKQRIMLARALALNPKILLLDDFTARVDTRTEQSILANIEKNYPGITLLSVTQKVSSVESYDQIIVLMEGEVLATGTHEELLRRCPEYVQIFNSQQSTSTYELHAE